MNTALDRASRRALPSPVLVHAIQGSFFVEWWEDELGPLWTGVLLLLLPLPICISLVDFWLGLVAAPYSGFLVWKLVESFRTCRRARMAG